MAEDPPMSSAYHPRPRSLNKRSLALSIAIHLLVLLAFLIQRYRPLPEPAQPPPLTLDFPIAQPEPPSVATERKPAPEEPQPAKQSLSTVHPEKAGTVPPPAAPAPMRLVQPLVQLPTFTPAQNGSGSTGTASTGQAGTGSAPTGGGAANAPGNGAAAGASRSDADTADRPDWIVKPTSRQEFHALSSIAYKDRANGWALLSCFVTRANTVRQCKVVSQSPNSDRYGFGDSALRLSEHFRIRPPMRDGQPRYDIRVRIPVFWDWN
jgi:periplasmic protein TonB